MQRVSTTILFDGHPLRIGLDLKRNPKIIIIDAKEQSQSLNLKLDFPLLAGESVESSFTLLPHSSARIEVNKSTESFTSEGVVRSIQTKTRDHKHLLKRLQGISLTEPSISHSVKSLRGPDYPLLTHETVKSSDANAMLLVDIDDPVGDDVGAGASEDAPLHYTYPANPAVLPGSFDITHFTVKYDSTSAYFTLRFRALSNPGWHPEYGFQLTFALLVRRQDDHGGAGVGEFRTVSREAGEWNGGGRKSERDSNVYDQLVVSGM